MTLHIFCCFHHVKSNVKFYLFLCRFLIERVNYFHVFAILYMNWSKEKFLELDFLNKTHKFPPFSHISMSKSRLMKDIKIGYKWMNQSWCTTCSPEDLLWISAWLIRFPGRKSSSFERTETFRRAFHSPGKNIFMIALVHFF